MDVVGDRGNDHPFDLDRDQWEVQPLQGISYNQVTGQPLAEFNQWVPATVDNSFNFTHDSLSTAPSNGAVFAKLLAKTNPSRPVVDLPVAFAELRELPRLVKQTGELITKFAHNREGTKDVAGAFLSYQFGWKPLLNDLKGLMDFQDHFVQREREIRGIFQGGGVKRRRTIEEVEKLGGDTVFLYTLAGSIYARRYWRTSRKIWATTRWVPNDWALPPRTDDEIRALARKSVHGLSVSPATLWQGVPWTWLIDWFSSAGDFLEAYRNTVPATFERGNVMTHIRTDTTIHRDPMDDGYTSVGGGNAKFFREKKSRRQVSHPTVAASFPFLDTRQVSILGALSVTRGRR